MKSISLEMNETSGVTCVRKALSKTRRLKLLIMPLHNMTGGQAWKRFPT